jgi:hypothetical protein
MILLQDIMSLRSMMGESSMVRVSDQGASSSGAARRLFTSIEVSSGIIYFLLTFRDA